MKRIAFIKWASLTAAEIGVVAFWALGIKGLTDAAAHTFIATGCCSFVALIAIWAEHIKKNNLCLS